jgi:hypothetical protein
MKMKKSQKQPPETPETPEPPELQISYVQNYECLTSFRRVIMKTQKRLSLTPERPVTQVGRAVDRLPDESWILKKIKKPSPPSPPTPPITAGRLKFPR